MARPQPAPLPDDMPAPVEPRPTLSRPLRALVEDRIERLIAILDATQPDPDLEPDDFAEEDDHPEDDGITEYDLGSTENVNHDTAWAPQATSQWFEPEGEPMLGWAELESRFGRYEGNTVDGDEAEDDDPAE